MLIQSFIKQLTLVAKQCFFHAFNRSDHLQLRPYRQYTPIFALPWQCDIMEYSSITAKNDFQYEILTLSLIAIHYMKYNLNINMDRSVTSRNIIKESDLLTLLKL